MKIIIIIFLFLLSPKILLSQNLFDTEFYEISFISDNVENDKLIKIKEIKFLSIKKLLSNILINQDYNLINKNLDEDLINTFIKNINFEDEKIIQNNYYSKIKVNYNKKKIIRYLRKKNISYVEFIPENIFTIIYEKHVLSNDLFSKNNGHYEYLLNNKKIHNFYKVPNLDINDRYLLNDNDIENINIKRIKNFLKKYSTNESIIIVSNYNENNIENEIYLYLDSKIIYLNKVSFIDNNYKNFFNILKKEIINNWKIENKIQNKFVNKIDCKIKYFNLFELKQIKKNLNNISIIQRAVLKNFSFRNNLYKIYYYGNTNILKKLFELNNMNVNIDNNSCKIFLI